MLAEIIFESVKVMDRSKARCYKFLKEMGKGAHGTVWKAVEQVSGRVCAIKRLNGRFSKYENHSNLAEVNCLQNLSPHKNILGLHDVILDGSTLYLVLEFMECNLLELILRGRGRGRGRPLSEDKVSKFCFEIFKGLAHMHKEGYCHCDLKLENLLVTGNIIKIADFGLAKNLLDDVNEPLQSYVVTRPYRAPELLLGSTHYDFAIDMWAMGVIMAELLSGDLLFSGSNMVEQMNNICSVIGSPDEQTWLPGLELAASMKYRFPEKFVKVSSITQLCSLLPRASAQAIDLMNLLLSWNPKKRPTAIEALQHPFFYAIPGYFLVFPSKSHGVQKPCDHNGAGMGKLQINPNGRGVHQPEYANNWSSNYFRSSFQYSIR